MTDHYAEMWRQVMEDAAKNHVPDWKWAMMLLESAEHAADKASKGFSREKPKAASPR